MAAAIEREEREGDATSSSESGGESTNSTSRVLYNTGRDARERRRRRRDGEEEDPAPIAVAHRYALRPVLSTSVTVHLVTALDTLVRWAWDATPMATIVAQMAPMFARGPVEFSNAVFVCADRHLTAQGKQWAGEALPVVTAYREDTKARIPEFVGPDPVGELCGAATRTVLALQDRGISLADLLASREEDVPHHLRDYRRLLIARHPPQGIARGLYSAVLGGAVVVNSMGAVERVTVKASCPLVDGQHTTSVAVCEMILLEYICTCLPTLRDVVVGYRGAAVLQARPCCVPLLVLERLDYTLDEVFTAALRAGSPGWLEYVCTVGLRVAARLAAASVYHHDLHLRNIMVRQRAASTGAAPPPDRTCARSTLASPSTSRQTCSTGRRTPCTATSCTAGCWTTSPTTSSGRAPSGICAATLSRPSAPTPIPSATAPTPPPSRPSWSTSPRRACRTATSRRSPSAPTCPHSHTSGRTSEKKMEPPVSLSNCDVIQ